MIIYLKYFNNFTLLIATVFFNFNEIIANRLRKTALSKIPQRYSINYKNLGVILNSMPSNTTTRLAVFVK